MCPNWCTFRGEIFWQGWRKCLFIIIGNDNDHDISDCFWTPMITLRPSLQSQIPQYRSALTGGAGTNFERLSQNVHLAAWIFVQSRSHALPQGTSSVNCDFDARVHKLVTSASRTPRPAFHATSVQLVCHLIQNLVAIQKCTPSSVKNTPWRGIRAAFPDFSKVFLKDESFEIN